MPRLVAFLLFLLSGIAGLLYQVLWQRQLGLIFGNTAHAAAATLAIFFVGLGLGGWAFGERAARSRRPLRDYGLLELALAGTALLFFAALPLHRSAYAVVFQATDGAGPALAAARLALAAIVLLPPAFCMGGTLPLMGQHLIRSLPAVGRTGTLLYAVNTLGGAIGALAAGFWLPAAYGTASSYLGAVGVSAAVGAIAVAVAPAAAPAAPPERARVPPPALGRRAALALAALSGLCALALEVLWTRMFALVLHNSVYSFALVLTVFLLSLALGALLASGLARSGLPARPTLYALLVGAGVAVAVTPWSFHLLTGGLDYLAADARWYAYLRAVAAATALVLLVPGMLVGGIFPYLLHAAAGIADGPGRLLGRLAGANAAGAVIGALLGGFVLLDQFGLWGGLRALAFAYLASAAAVAGALGARYLALPLLALLAFATLLDPDRLPVVRRLDGERVLDQRESAYGVTAVVERSGARRLKMDNHYALGGTGARRYEQTQADIPLVIHSAPRTVFVLGLGTGITAGATLQHGIERLTVVELVPDVVAAARDHFGPWLNGLFDDARAQVVSGDARSHLRAGAARYDVVIGDLFIPWQAGAAALYTREHFATVRDRLAPGGLFAQWLPLYQLSRDEFFVIARTMLDVFPQVTLWRGDFLADRPIVALVGQAEPAPLDPRRVVDNFRRRGGAATPAANALALTALFYAGNLSANRALFADHMANTDDRPVLEYSSPITQREQRGNAATWFVGAALERFLVDLADRLPDADDPYLALLDADARGAVDAGRALFRAKVAQAEGRTDDARRFAAAFTAAVPRDVQRLFAEREQAVRSAAAP